MNPEDFPYDCQTCFVRLNYGIKAKGYIQFKVPDYFRNTFPTYVNHVWSLVSTSLEVPDTNAGTAFHFDIVLKRKPTYFVFIIVVPSVILSVVTVAVYFIPAEEGEKIGCGMTILLTFMVFQTQMADYLPENSDVTPIIGLYFMMIMASCSLVTIDSIIMSNHIPASNITTENDEGEGVQKTEDTGFVGIKKRAPRLNRWSLCHYTLGAISFLIIAAAHVLLLEKSVSASCAS
ncbi:5-hydroxytryptamine receptor 3A [Mizuhopecten yessoensis]|uniref:5-hydroxytryptamine receptor 3A n=2 Tax=Mizuhopecten yessoensis TaxID=6573 RepID=A0A210PS37_MIZYE|nr:5-hydroxytryptamine receptor 3A [Mizuhopecten yessoensis]